MTDLTKLTIAQATDGLKNKEFTAVELTQSYIDQMEKTRGLGAYITETPELALDGAKKADENIASGNMRPMEGMPIAHKDLLCTKGVKTTAGSKMLDNFVPDYESTVSQKLADSGAISLGKVNLDQFGMGSTTQNSFYDTTKNPWGDDLVPGGSSGGSAAAVSARSAIATTGTDTGGSIRQPSAFCGVAGIRPTYGRVSRWGVIAYASSLDQVGPIGKDVRDCAIMLNNMSGHDAKDATSAKVEVPNFENALTGDVKGMKIGIPKEYSLDNMPAEIAKVWEDGKKMLTEAGAEIVDVSLPHTKYALPAYYIIACAEASSNLSRYDGVRYGLRVDGKDLDEMYELTRSEGFGEEVKRRILMGTYVLSAGFYDAYYIKAQKVRRLVANDFKEALNTVDALLTPITPSPAFKFGENQDDPVQMYLNDVFSVTLNMAGLPGMSVPVGLSESGLPLGLQVIGKAFDEETVLKISYALETQAGFNHTPNV
ncbi:MAG: Asp-tRNA(Asn)/Glu-tRNA(Gln) amidotransferase subunit GatA [Alphaproteobacteria bacterium]